MSQEKSRGTITLARLYAQQGHWEPAVRIYRALLGENPAREDIRLALAEAEGHLAHRTPEALVPLFREWIELLFRRDRLRRLKRLKQRL
jgi:hypothetical protein